MICRTSRSPLRRGEFGAHSFNLASVHRKRASRLYFVSHVVFGKSPDSYVAVRTCIMPNWAWSVVTMLGSTSPLRVLSEGLSEL
jgi:hypothetical protein